MPILAICRGAQALNIVRGGSLHQHLPDLSEEIRHRQSIPGDRPSHEARLVPGSRLAAALGAEADAGADEPTLGVNSFHHQAIERVGEGLAVSARAPDGTVEAIEDPGRPFLIGVQWHAEVLLDRPYESGLFRSFVDACRREAAAGRRRPGRIVA
jgi:putative glutamine amidotransferase